MSEINNTGVIEGIEGIEVRTQGSLSKRTHDNSGMFNNPFDLNTYPMTNPPLFDQSMFVNFSQDGMPVLRRRISISNGQIGQIINHEAIFDDNYDVVSNETTPIDLHEKSRFNQALQPQVLQNSGGGFGMVPGSHDEFQSHPLPNTNNHDPTSHPIATPLPSSLPPELQAHYSVGPKHQRHPAAPGVGVGAPCQTFTQAPVVGGIPSQGPGAVPSPSAPATVLSATNAVFSGPQEEILPVPDDSQEHTVYAGVPPPNHQLIYNNEVIYNPNNGPVPGTSAWKRDRLLERNRVAASKCRQRKKQAQQQLLDDIRELKIENSDLRGKLDNYDKFFQSMKRFFNQNSSGDGFAGFNNFEHFDVINKAMKSKNQSEFLKVLDAFDIPDPNSAFPKSPAHEGLVKLENVEDL
ncbi:hypothetical protein PSN45_004654 [Yamadazyma tenuis]|uniref:BZIP domain-containing protein n=1 Tax=Candida tenuis (strain ATCC 10573 / BCRC 21748 / CBS 615 / JCM 9827 / NBRC 10315 / NRRL Y-1498 / VKM Y-70) TaxID=590646 RepID=G3B722_CANTC|nr:uncharacterized protein CANTEDRAFT_114387 [Yamadazyma tenuis ATCC 10573]EGV63078.1 hypothetical protein CANTEDRAFT_114387 [Yamadazyma tenuis ATCC 10573]WEJ97106.1 hypothetical protein PSN45_004654 [Yamadazyma tenuis]